MEHLIRNCEAIVFWARMRLRLRLVGARMRLRLSKVTSVVKFMAHEASLKQVRSKSKFEASLKQV